MTDTLAIADRTRDRYLSLALSNVWRLEQLRRAVALVVGAGALGNEVGKNLALMGVRLIIIVDKDTVEVSNLSRSVFFRESDHGQPKAQVLARRLHQLNPDVAVLPLDGALEDVVGLGLLRRADLVFSCLDNRRARVALGRMCHKVGRPWVDGAMENLDGEVAVYTPGAGPCYECLLTEVDRRILAEATSCKHVLLRNVAGGRVPTTSTMGSIIAALQVQEAIKLLHGPDPRQRSLAGRRLVVNAGLNDFYAISGDRKEDCPGHTTYGTITEVHDWSRRTTTPRRLIERAQDETGGPAHLALGRDLVLGIDCPHCGRPTRWRWPLPSPIPPERALCPGCGEMAEPVLIHVVTAADVQADWPLERLGAAALDVFEVRTPAGPRWYELSGDLTELPAELQGNPQAPSASAGTQGERRAEP
jgi:adenylyltransferase/sulfurtransferase